MRESNVHTYADPELRNRIGQANAGRRRSADTRERIRDAALRRSSDSRRLSPEAREKRRQAALHRSPEHRQKLHEAQFGRRQSAATRERILERRLAWAAAKMTAIERLLHEEFKQRHLGFIMHLPMWGRFQPDFVFEQARLIVQADGHFHSYPKIAARDAAFNRTAAAEGWTVWRFSDKEIKADAPAIGRAVAAFVRRAEKTDRGPS